MPVYRSRNAQSWLPQHPSTVRANVQTFFPIWKRFDAMISSKGMAEETLRKEFGGRMGYLERVCGKFHGKVTPKLQQEAIARLKTYDTDNPPNKIEDEELCNAYNDAYIASGGYYINREDEHKELAEECFKKTELYTKVQNALGGAGSVAALGGVEGIVNLAKNLSKIVNTPPKPEEAYEKFAGRRTTRRKRGGNHILKMFQSNGIDPRDIVDTYTKCLNEVQPEDEVEKFAGSRHHSHKTRRSRKTRRRHK